MQQLWFKRKLYGWGWRPVTWQGWLSVVVYIVVFATGEVVFIDRAQQHAVGPVEVSIFLAFVLFTTAALIWLCIKKGESPRWQWGTRVD